MISVLSSALRACAVGGKIFSENQNCEIETAKGFSKVAHKKEDYR